MSKGIIQFLFKGMFMHTEKATVVNTVSSCIIVKREDDGHLFEFTKVKNEWLLKNHLSTNSLLCGTNFVFE
jgi:hypothetical protein